MRTLLFLCAFFLSGTFIYGQDLAMTSPIELNGPGIVWGSQTFDLGSLEPGKTTTVNFTFTNNGNKALIIERVRTSCGCTASDYPKEPIAPGESSSIEVSYRSGSLGSFSKSITVYSNATDPVSTLKIKGSVN